MNVNRRQFALALTATAATPLAAQELKFDVNVYRDGSKTIPVSLSGFTGEVASALRFDLEVAGCSVVGPESAVALVHAPTARASKASSPTARKIISSPKPTPARTSASSLTPSPTT